MSELVRTIVELFHGERWQDMIDVARELQADERHTYRACGDVLLEVINYLLERSGGSRVE